MKKPIPVLFVHSAGRQDNPGQGSFDLVVSLRNELSHEFEVRYPVIDDPEAPTYAMWKKLFHAEINIKNEPLLIIGHSLGASMLLKYLSEENTCNFFSGLFLIATPFWGVNNWEVEDFVIRDEFKSKFKNMPSVYFYHSKNDEIVPFNHLSIYKKLFSNSTGRVLSGNDHAFTNGLPELVADIKGLNY